MKVIRFIIAAALIADPVIAALSQPASANGVGRSGAAHGARSTSAHSIFHRRRQAGVFWPGAAGLYYGPANGKSEADVSEPVLAGSRDTCTYDIPWDWVHRCPPFASSPEPVVAPLAPLVVVPRGTGCPAQTVTVPMSDGKEQTITIVRC
jgi:hypothetical protein